MSEGHLPPKARRIVKALIEVVKPRKPGFDLPVEDYMVDFLDQFYAYFPFHMKLGFPLGLLLLEYGTFIFAGKITPFSKLPLDQREKYVKGWIASRMALRRDLIKGVKGVCLTAFYSHPDAMAHIGYDLPGHIDFVNEGGPCDREACDYFRGLGYDRNRKVPYPAYDHVTLIPDDTAPEGEAG